MFFNLDMIICDYATQLVMSHIWRQIKAPAQALAFILAPNEVCDFVIAQEQANQDTRMDMSNLHAIRDAHDSAHEENEGSQIHHFQRRYDLENAIDATIDGVDGVDDANTIVILQEKLNRVTMAGLTVPVFMETVLLLLSDERGL